MVILDFQPSIHIILKKLIDQKSKRDNVKFTAFQLAQALEMPRSIITKLTHPDKSKRVTNPRIDTLIKIVDFFRNDGFYITLEDLIGKKSIDKTEQNSEPETSLSVPVYTFDYKKKERMGTIDLKIKNGHPDIFGLYANIDVEPFFKIGSIFVVDPHAKLENDHLIVIKIKHEILLKKYYLEKNKIILKSLNSGEKNIIIMPTEQHEILGVVVQVNAKV